MSGSQADEKARVGARDENLGVTAAVQGLTRWLEW